MLLIKCQQSRRICITLNRTLSTARFTREICLARLAGFEPAAYYLEGSCSIQLSYRRKKTTGQTRNFLNLLKLKLYEFRRSDVKDTVQITKAVYYVIS